MKQRMKITLTLAAILVIASASTNAEIVDIGVETDKPTYLLEEPVTVFVTAYNPNPEAVTLGFGSTLQATYLMEDVFDWTEGKEFAAVVTSVTIEPDDSYVWVLTHGLDEMMLYPLDVGVHSVVGVVVGYGQSTPIEFEVIPESSPTVTRYVPDEYPTIQAAIDDCSDGDIVIVDPGIYTGPGNRDIDFLGRAITVRSVDPNNPDCVDSTIIDCQGTETELHRGFYFHSGEGADSVLKGFTITNGCAYKGGGIYCRFSSSPTIDNCIIRGNMAPFAPGFPGYFPQDGGGIYCSKSSPIISNCHLFENVATGGGGAIYSYDGSASVRNCIITGNRANIGGGGIGLYKDNMSIHNCLVTGNSACMSGQPIGAGGGIRSSRSTPTISNCTLSGNLAAQIGGGIYMVGGDALLTSSILWNNAAQEGPEIGLSYSGFEWSILTVSYSDVEGGTASIYVNPASMLNWDERNIDANPFFADPGYWDPNGTPGNTSDDFWVDGDYRLLPVSPCINTGDPNYVPEPDETDLDGNPRIIGTAIDMGAYEANPIEAKLRMLPRVINRRSRMRYIIAIVRLPKGIERGDIDSDEPLTLYPGEIEAERQYVLRGRRRKLRSVRILAFFDKADFTAAVPENGTVEVAVVGRVKTGRYFYGTDEIRVIDRRSRRSRRSRRK